MSNAPLNNSTVWPRSCSRTETTSNRHATPPVRLRNKYDSAMALRRCRFCHVIDSNGVPKPPPVRAFTSTKTSTAPSRATMSISPQRVRNRRSTMTYPRRCNSSQARSSPRFPNACRRSTPAEEQLPCRVAVPSLLTPHPSPLQRQRPYFLFHRVPDEESSSTIPASTSCWRMRSPSAKSRRLRASWRAATSRSISSAGRVVSRSS